MKKKYKKSTIIGIRLQKRQIRLLKSVLDIDRDQLHGENKIQTLLEMAEKRLTKLKKEGMTASTRKEAQHREYAVSRG